MVVLGADLHKRSHTVVVIEATGRKLAEKTVPATGAGHLELRRWAARWPERRGRLEDCRHLSRRLDAELVRRRRAGRPGAAQAHGRRPALGRGARQERPDRRPRGRPGRPPRARPAGRHARRPRARGPPPRRPPRGPRRRADPATSSACAGSSSSSAVAGARARARSAGRSSRPRSTRRSPAGPSRSPASPATCWPGSVELTAAIDALEREITASSGQLAPSLLALPGCGALTAAKIVGETAGHRPLPLQGGLRPPQRHGARPGLVGQHRPPPAQPRRQPPAQRRPPPDRHHPDPAGRSGQGLPRQAAGGRRHQDRGHPGPPTTTQRRGLPLPASR